MDQRSETTSYYKRDSDTMQHGELRSYWGSRLVNEFFLQFSSFSFNDTFKTGEALFYSSSSSSSSHTVNDTKTRERENRIESDVSPVTVSTKVDERSKRPDVDQANKTPKTNKKEPQENGETVVCCPIWQALPSQPKIPKN